jgi:hypothetical protein
MYKNEKEKEIYIPEQERRRNFPIEKMYFNKFQ